jgi:hypothetical protein
MNLGSSYAIILVGWRPLRRVRKHWASYVKMLFSSSSVLIWSKSHFLTLSWRPIRLLPHSHLGCAKSHSAGFGNRASRSLQQCVYTDESTVTSCPLPHRIKYTIFLSLISILEVPSHADCTVVPEVDAATVAAGVQWMQRQSGKVYVRCQGWSHPTLLTMCKWGYCSVSFSFSTSDFKCARVSISVLYH